jgi:hypothetical protein
MTNHAITAAACAALGLLIAGQASAACSLSAQPLAVKMDTFRPMLDVKVNGKISHFLIDSSTAVNMISRKFAQSAKLTMSGGSGAGPAVATASTFEFAGTNLKNAQFLVSDTLPDVEGVIGQTLLHQADVEFDLSMPTPSVKLAKTEGCEGSNMAYWAKDGDSFWEANLTTPESGAPFLQTDVIVNGVKLRGIFASGKFYTTITEKAAAKAGLKTTDPGVKPLGPTGKVWMGMFKSVIVGNEESPNAMIEIDRTNDDFYDVLIGADFLSAHHLYVANSQQKIYFTRAARPPGAPPLPAGAPLPPVFKVHAAPPRGLSTEDETSGHLTNHFTTR